MSTMVCLKDGDTLIPGTDSRFVDADLSGGARNNCSRNGSMSTWRRRHLKCSDRLQWTRSLQRGELSENAQKSEVIVSINDVRTGYGHFDR
jgi:hypothetical protein